MRVGFVFTRDDPFVGIDLDHCRDPETGKIKPWALEIVAKLNSYSEVSPSGTGLHIHCDRSPTAGQQESGRCGDVR